MEIYYVSSRNLKQTFTKHKNIVNLHMNLCYYSAISLLGFIQEKKKQIPTKSLLEEYL